MVLAVLTTTYQRLRKGRLQFELRGGPGKRVKREKTGVFSYEKVHKIK